MLWTLKHRILELLRERGNIHELSSEKYFPGHETQGKIHLTTGVWARNQGTIETRQCQDPFAKMQGNVNL